jgi:hypothetical protein
MDVGRVSGKPHGDSKHTVAESTTFGAVDVSWTSPLRIFA